MRPTNLGFRSPKERTAEFTLPSVTFDGRSLPFMQNHPHSTMPMSKRFVQYETAARRTNTSVGPGSYNLREDPLSHWHISGTPKIRPYHALKDPSSNGYFFIGNQMVFDSNFAKKTRKSSRQSLETTEIRTNRLATSNTPRRDTIKPQDSLEKMKNSPYLAHRLKNNVIIA